MANTNEKMNERAFLNVVLTGTVTPEALAYATAKLEALDKKNADRRNKLTPAQLENEQYKVTFTQTATAGTEYTATTVAEMLGVSKQKASALMRALKDAGVVTESETKSATGKGKVKAYTLTGAEYVAKTNPEKTEG